jgi:hypothetical protein
LPSCQSNPEEAVLEDHYPPCSNVSRHAEQDVATILTIFHFREPNRNQGTRPRIDSQTLAECRHAVLATRSRSLLTTPLKMPITTTNCQRTTPPKRQALRPLFGLSRLMISHRQKSRIVQHSQLTVNSSCWLAKFCGSRHPRATKLKPPGLELREVTTRAPTSQPRLTRAFFRFDLRPQPIQGRHGRVVSAAETANHDRRTVHCDDRHSCRRVSRRVSGVMYRPSGRSSIGSGKIF